MKKILSVVSLIMLSLVFSGITYASQVTGTLQVSANVVSVCTVSTSPVNFGNVTGPATDTTGDVTVNCPANTAYHIALDAGQHYVSTYRRIVSGSNSPYYALLKTNNMADEWSDSGCGSGTYPYGACLDDTGNGSNQAHTVYAHMFAFGGIPAGTTLTDTVTVTVYY